MSTFGQINLFVGDMAASIEFYRLLELEVPDSYEWPAGSGAEHIDDIYGDKGFYMALDNYRMARIWNPRFEPDRIRGNIVIGMLVETRDDVDRLYDTVKAAGHPVGQQPYDAFFGSRYAVVIDPDGNQVGLKSPIEYDRKYEPDFEG
jgi:uncharacterized glyoxalase superfamily protein PhnB